MQPPKVCPVCGSKEFVVTALKMPASARHQDYKLQCKCGASIMFMLPSAVVAKIKPA